MFTNIKKWAWAAIIGASGLSCPPVMAEKMTKCPDMDIMGAYFTEIQVKGIPCEVVSDWYFDVMERGLGKSKALSSTSVKVKQGSLNGLIFKIEQVRDPARGPLDTVPRFTFIKGAKKVYMQGIEAIDR